MVVIETWLFSLILSYTTLNHHFEKYYEIEKKEIQIILFAILTTKRFFLLTFFDISALKVLINKTLIFQSVSFNEITLHAKMEKRTSYLHV